MAAPGTGGTGGIVVGMGPTAEGAGEGVVAASWGGGGAATTAAAGASAAWAATAEERKV
jgi:hypothetical protein